MRVLLINHLYPEGGGAEAAVRGLAQFLKVQGHEVAVLTLGDDSVESGMSGRDENGVQIYSYKTLSRHFSEKLRICIYDDRSICKRMFFRIGAFFYDWFNLIGPLGVFRLIREIKPDVVHTHNLRGMGMLLPFAIRLVHWTPSPRLPSFDRAQDMLFRGRTRWRWIHTLHDIQLVYPSGVLIYSKPAQKFEIFRKIYEQLQKLVWGSPDVVVSPSVFLKKFYAERGFFRKSKFEVIPNVIMGAAQGDEEMGEGKNSISFNGALEDSKGIQILLEAAQKLAHEFQQRAFILDIIGDGSLRNQLAAQYARFPWIRFRGALKAKALAHVHARALVTVIPSLTQENAPMAILESFHFGAPVVASRIGGIPEYVKEGETGWLFNPGSVDELVALLRKITNNGVSEEISRNCQRVSVDLGVQAYAGHAALYNSS